MSNDARKPVQRTRPQVCRFLPAPEQFIVAEILKLNVTKQLSNCLKVSSKRINDRRGMSVVVKGRETASNENRSISFYPYSIICVN